MSTLLFLYSAFRAHVSALYISFYIIFVFRAAGPESIQICFSSAYRPKPLYSLVSALITVAMHSRRKKHFKLHCLGKITGEISPRSGARELRYQSGRNRQNRYSCKGICWTHQSYCRIFTVAENNQSCAFFRRGRPVIAFQVARDGEREWKHSAISSP